MEEPAAYIKKPVKIEAIEWTGKNIEAVLKFTHGESHHKIQSGLTIYTLEGYHQATVGDMIIKGVNGEFYPCKPDIFKKTYYSAVEYAELTQR